MKRLFAILLVSVSVCVACKKSSSPVTGNSVKQKDPDSTVFISATINGGNWQTDSAFGYKVKYSGNDSSTSNLLINATRTNNGGSTTISFNVTRFNGPGTYPVNPPLVTATYYVGTQRHFATTGNIVVMSDTAYALRGTFSFRADTITVDNGKFDVALP
jgi:hypothetical protein